MIVDPWGDIIARTGTEPALAISVISLDRIRTIRERIPILANRRIDIY
jgi:predicted amidohydrolase